MGDERSAANAVTPGAARGQAADGARSSLASALLALALAVGCWSVGAGRAGAASETVDECVRRKVAAGEQRSVALAACLAASDHSTVPPGGTPGLSSTSSDDGTSSALLIAVGLGGAVVGAGIAIALRGRRGAATGTATPAMAPAALPTMAPPSATAAPAARTMAPPSAGPAGANGATAGLVDALIDLSDRVPSQALRAEILAALGRAGVHPVEPAVGEAFDAARMRGVGGTPAPDASWTGRVASVERTGFHDGVSVLRVPEVVVYTAGS